MNHSSCDAVVIGGGFFGCAVAAYLAAKEKRVVLLEKGTDLMERASYHNQARIHQGYHYPRSLLTALRSRLNYPRFVAEYADCVSADFAHYYAVPRLFSKVSARQFRLFMERIGAPIQKAPSEVKNLFDPRRIEEVFEVTEPAFDSRRLRTLVSRQMKENGVNVWLRHEAWRVVPSSDGKLRVDARGPDEKATTWETTEVFNCTYANLNQVLSASGLPRLKLKQEITEMALVELPSPLRNMAFTVMCGPFFSTMPFPSVGLHTLSHVRYTPHASWIESPESEQGPCPDDLLHHYPKLSRFRAMRQDASRFLPLLAGARQQGSLWEIKTVLPQSEVDDSRPILFREIVDRPGLYCLMGGKIDNIFDVFDELDKINTLSHGSR